MSSHAQGRNGKRRPGVRHPLYPILALAFLLFSAACGDSPQPTSTPAVRQDGPTLTQSSQTEAVRTPVLTTPDSPSSFTGQLDPTFGKGGKVTTDLGSGTETIRGSVIQSDGKIVVVGDARPLKGQQTKFTLVRYNEDGSLDTTFGDKGIVATNILGTEYDYSVSYALLLQGDGKIVAVGSVFDPEHHHDVFAAARYNPDGSLDESFGDGGKMRVPVNPEPLTSANDTAVAVALAPDGKIVLAGSTGAYPPDFGTARLNADGSIDETFGDGGVVITDLRKDDDGAHAVAVQDDGKVLVAGYSSKGGSADFYDFAIVRYNQDGSLDDSFGEGGKVTTDISGGDKAPDRVYAITLLPEGKIVVAGTVSAGAQMCQIHACWKNGFGLAQYNADGTLDTGFGDGGKVIEDFGFSAGNYSLVRTPDGKLATAGYVSQADFALVLYNPDGTRITSLSDGGMFGDKGLIKTEFGAYRDEAYAIALQPDGKLIVAGTAVVDPNDILNGDFALVRYK